MVLVVAAWHANLHRVALLPFYAKEEGDVLFQSLPRMALTEAIEGITESRWSHCGILLKREGRWVVAEAIGEVRETPLVSWVMRGRGGVMHAYRLRVRLTESERSGLAEATRGFMGRPYDYRYAPDDEAIYCSELVHKAYARGVGRTLGEWETLGALNWEPHEGFIREMENGALPLERPMVTPVGLTRDSQLERVYPR